LMFEFAQCASELVGTEFENELKSGALKNDVTSTRFFNQYALPSVISKGMQEYFDIAFFGDTTLGVGAQDYMKLTDGIWKKLIAGTALASEDSTGGFDVGRSNDIVTLNQTVGTRAVDYFQNLYAGDTSVNAKVTPFVLRNMPAKDKVIMCTLNVWNNYLAYLQDQGASGGGNITYTMDGIPTLKFNGIEVIPFGRWDEVIAGQLAGVDPYRIIYTTRDNIRVSREIAADALNFDAWFDQTANNTYARGGMQLGVEYVWGSLAQISY